MLTHLRCLVGAALCAGSIAVYATDSGTEITADAWQCPPIFQHQMRQLHSSQVVDLCELVAGQPVLLVNTASHCGFTKQFGDLEAIHQRYKDRGLLVVGVSSDSFNQEADDEAAAADVCFRNFGVSFTMLATVPVRGEDAHPLFQEIARQDVAPKWNFYKYQIDRSGNVVASNSSMRLPSDRALESLLKP